MPGFISDNSVCSVGGRVYIVVDPYRRVEPVRIPVEHRKAGSRCRWMTTPADKVVLDDAERPIVGLSSCEFGGRDEVRKPGNLRSQASDELGHDFFRWLRPPGE